MSNFRKYKGFYPRLFINESDEAMNKYYERVFHIPYADRFAYVEENDKVVAYVEDSPIIKNPDTFKDFDNGVRIIIDKNADMYVAKYDGNFNHGMMANALIRAREIKTLWYNEDGRTYKEIAGIYEDQENFLLLQRLLNTNKIVQSDTFEYKGEDVRELLQKIKNKHPNFQLYVRYKEDDFI